MHFLRSLNKILKQHSSFPKYKSIFKNYIPHKEMAKNVSDLSHNLKREYTLKNVLAVFEKIAPLKYAQTWDNVGLLLEPTPTYTVSKMLLTNDLTLEVFEEAVEANVNLIYSYHPPIFTSFKSLQYDHWKSKIVIGALEKRIAIYSPHTALDVVHHGVNDWLISCFDYLTSQVITPVDAETEPHYLIEVSLLGGLNSEDIKSQLLVFENVSIQEVRAGEEGPLLCFLVPNKSLDKVLSYLNSQRFRFALTSHQEVGPLVGLGRQARLKTPLTISEAIQLVKSHIGVEHLRLALAPNHTLNSSVSSVAVCAGSGASILQKASADLMVTGEMSHHDTLELNHKGSSVIFCEHSNSERGFLKTLAQRLQISLPDLTILLSTKDHDPIKIV